LIRNELRFIKHFVITALALAVFPNCLRAGATVILNPLTWTCGIQVDYTTDVKPISNNPGNVSAMACCDIYFFYPNDKVPPAFDFDIVTGACDACPGAVTLCANDKYVAAAYTHFAFSNGSSLWELEGQSGGTYKVPIIRWIKELYNYISGVPGDYRVVATQGSVKLSVYSSVIQQGKVIAQGVGDTPTLVGGYQKGVPVFISSTADGCGCLSLTDVSGAGIQDPKSGSGNGGDGNGNGDGTSSDGTSNPNGPNGAGCADGPP
jgi:hypothetical protein